MFKILLMPISLLLVAPTDEPDMKAIGDAYHFCQGFIHTSTGKQSKVKEFIKAVEEYIAEDRRARSRDPYFQAPDYVAEVYRVAEKVSGIKADHIKERFMRSDRIYKEMMKEQRAKSKS